MDTIINQIARNILRIDSLQPRHSDRDDFHEVHVESLREALEAAYRAGLDAATVSP